ncbi:MAG: Sir2 family NAD-dependent protein deacetylase [Pseudomonadota bacterium]
MKQPAEQLAELLGVSERVVIFTGAGISTESGIPDFRSPGGVWTKTKPVYFQDFVSSGDARRKAWQQKLDSHQTIQTAAPNRGHRAVEKLVRNGKVTHVITQNIDGLHQASGIPDGQVVELHGNSTYAHCLECKRRYELEPLLKAFETDGTMPLCASCGGLVKTATISFGQAMPEGPMRDAEAASTSCDLFISIGSSLVVYPAAGFPLVAKQAGAKLVILNRDPTDLDTYADLVLNTEIGPTLGDAVGVN